MSTVSSKYAVSQVEIYSTMVQDGIIGGRAEWRFDCQVGRRIIMRTFCGPCLQFMCCLSIPCVFAADAAAGAGVGRAGCRYGVWCNLIPMPMLM